MICHRHPTTPRLHARTITLICDRHLVVVFLSSTIFFSKSLSSSKILWCFIYHRHLVAVPLVCCGHQRARRYPHKNEFYAKIVLSYCQKRRSLTFPLISMRSFSSTIFFSKSYPDIPAPIVIQPIADNLTKEEENHGGFVSSTMGDISSVLHDHAYAMQHQGISKAETGRITCWSFISPMRSL